ncbi:Antibiotic biosynthesis monooxygenase [Actinacidiphila yanglinensis]|uniref:Antibiotic biosynthesis monooxygenase n=1 Tax=Actinacidiphila yanglinensis TaxID=310779 RepID=A0A1H6ECE5_9ACTN|nr:antibiotic biosynthesis monooxygenase [Actinacidiphila yanglinensis]SEG94943.1 Antibiotic biosynthesis monooxygenase [Actinacidiphila yanglinensis]
MTTDPIPAAAVVRVSRGNFDPARFPEVQEATAAISSFLIPVVKKLPGLISYYWATSPEGSMVNVSVWESEEHAEQMSRLKEMIVDARAITDKVGVVFIPIVNYPIDWTI